MAAAVRNGVRPLKSVTRGRRYSTSSVSNPASEACLLAALPAISSIRIRRKKINATAAPASRPSPGTDTDANRQEQQYGDHRVAGQIVEMTDPAGLAADPCQLTVGVVEEIRQDEQQGAHVRPAVGTRQERCRGGEAESEANSRQVIGRGPGVLQWRDQAARQPRIPGPWYRWRRARKKL
jgi:hypothetical protein